MFRRRWIWIPTAVRSWDGSRLIYTEIKILLNLHTLGFFLNKFDDIRVLIGSLVSFSVYSKIKDEMPVFVNLTFFFLFRGGGWGDVSL